MDRRNGYSKLDDDRASRKKTNAGNIQSEDQDQTAKPGGSNTQTVPATAKPGGSNTQTVPATAKPGGSNTQTVSATTAEQGGINTQTDSGTSQTGDGNKKKNAIMRRLLLPWIVLIAGVVSALMLVTWARLDPAANEKLDTLIVLIVLVCPGIITLLVMLRCIECFYNCIYSILVKCSKRRRSMSNTVSQDKKSSYLCCCFKTACSTPSMSNESNRFCTCFCENLKINETTHSKDKLAFIEKIKFVFVFIFGTGYMAHCAIYAAKHKFNDCNQDEKYAGISFNVLACTFAFLQLFYFLVTRESQIHTRKLSLIFVLMPNACIWLDALLSESSDIFDGPEFNENHTFFLINLFEQKEDMNCTSREDISKFIESTDPLFNPMMIEFSLLATHMIFVRMKTNITDESHSCANNGGNGANSGGSSESNGGKSSTSSETNGPNSSPSSESSGGMPSESRGDNHITSSESNEAKPSTSSECNEAKPSSNSESYGAKPRAETQNNKKNASNEESSNRGWRICYLLFNLVSFFIMVAFVMFTLYALLTDDGDDIYEEGKKAPEKFIIYVIYQIVVKSVMLISLFGMICLTCCVHRYKKDFDPPESLGLNDYFLLISGFGNIFYSSINIIPFLHSEPTDHADILSICENGFSILFAVLQNTILLLQGSKQINASQYVWLMFSFVNFGLWASDSIGESRIRSFTLVQYHHYTKTFWKVMIKIILPVTIFYRFHCAMEFLELFILSKNE